jgi:hypothetical protein
MMCVFPGDAAEVRFFLLITIVAVVAVTFPIKPISVLIFITGGGFFIYHTVQVVDFPLCIR